MPSPNRPTMLATRNPNYPGVRIKALRLALGITTRGVEDYTRRIARLGGNKAFLIPHSSLSEMEKPGAEPPGIHRLFSLCVIYRLSFRELLEIYGLDLNEITRLQMEIQLPQTHLISPDVHDLNRRIAFPEKINPELDVSETHLLSRMVQTWGEIPLVFLQHLGIKKRLYGYIGMKDFTLHPFIPPGSLVQIDDRDTRIQSRGWETNFDRPIYFLQLREGFACGWCQVDGGNLSIIPFSASRLTVRRFQFPGDVDVIGRVTGVAMLLTAHRRKVVSDISDRTA